MAGGGDGTLGCVDGMGTLATFNGPYGVAVTSVGDLIVADFNNNNIRQIVISSGLIHSKILNFYFACCQSSHSFSSINFTLPCSLHIFQKSKSFSICLLFKFFFSLYACYFDLGNVSTLAGGNVDYGYVDGEAILARFYGPNGVAVTSGGDVIVADFYNNNIRQIISSGIHILARNMHTQHVVSVLDFLASYVINDM